MGNWEAMGDTVSSHDMQALLEQSGWVRSLARRLAAGADADDVEQATWLAVLRRPAERGRPAREWLSAIARNVARAQRRADGRRVAHELGAARDEAEPATVDLLARAELQRKLVEAVIQLDEPYRTALLLRYFENLPPRSIAKRLGVPVATVRTRIVRGIERLRERFDASHGGRREAWIAAFAPLWPAPAPWSVGWGAVFVVNAKMVAGGCLLAAVGVLSWWMVGRTEPTRTEDVANTARAAEPAVTGGDAPVVATVAANEARSRSSVEQTPRAAPATNTAETAAAKPAAERGISGRVVDVEGRGVDGVRVIAESDGSARPEAADGAIAGPGGAFSIDSASKGGRLRVDSRDYVTLLAARFGPGARHDLALVAAPRIELAGVVSDEQGTPLDGARISISAPDDLRSRPGLVLDRAETQEWSVKSAADGAFAFDGAPQLAGAQISVRAEGFLPWHAPAPQQSDSAMEIALVRAVTAEGVLRGIVVDSASRPIAGACVALGLDTTRTADDGLFAFRLDDPRSAGRRVGAKASKITALAPGLAPAQFEPTTEAGKLLWPNFVTLKLEHPALSISGRVEDAGGTPMAGVRVYVSDPTLLGIVDGRPATMETLFAPGEGGWRFVESDDKGEFTIGGLLDREYVVRAHDSRTLLRVDSKPVHAGASHVVLQVPTDRLYPRVAGRIISKGGKPVDGAEVFAMCDALSIHYGTRPVSTHHDGLAPVVTDAEGRFELRNVPMSLAYLRVNGANILPVEYGRYVEGDPRFVNAVRELPRESIERLEIVVEARCHMQVQLGLIDLADELCVLDERGTELELSLFASSERREGTRQPLHDGRSDMLSVPESGRTLVLFKAGVEVLRSGIELDPSKPTTVRR